MKTVCKLKENCCGCTACFAICSKQAISMHEDEKGFVYPIIDEDKCIECGMCEKVCAFSDFNSNKEAIHKFYAIKHKDLNVVKSSQSGGAFTAFSDWVLEQGGVVYGAHLNTSDFSICHIRAVSPPQRDLIKGSKYVQSSMQDCFLDVMDDLKEGKTVLFTGTPCQCDGLLSLLKLKKINTEKLYTVDIICHGVPSQKVFQSFIKWNEQKNHKKVLSFVFREKTKYPWGEYREKIVFEDGKTVYSDWYANLFLNESSLRDCCYTCPYTSPVRSTDITIGDFWGIDNCHPEMHDRYGVSSLIVHSQNGAKLLEKVKKNLIIKEVAEKDLISSQRPLHTPANKPEKSSFWQNYFEMNFEDFLHTESFNTVTFKNEVKNALSYSFDFIKNLFSKKVNNKGSKNDKKRE